MSTLDDLNHLGLASKIAACHLDAIESQGVFAAMLGSLARPGSICRIPNSLISRMPCTIAPVVTLADVETKVHVADTAFFVWQDAVCGATGAEVSDFPDADLVVVPEDSLPSIPEIFPKLRVGTAFRPELGARIVIGVPSLGIGGSATNIGVTLALTGPGVRSEVLLHVGGMPSAALQPWITVNTNFPAGVDVWLVTKSGEIVGIPRSSIIRIAESSNGNGGI